MSTPSTTLSLASLPVTSLGITLLAVVVLYQIFLNPLLLSPLSRVPGPKLAAFSSLWLNIHYYFETGVPRIKELHDKYGPIVRVGPNEVVIDDPKQLSLIYGVRSNFPKPTAAVLFENYGFPNAFSAVTREEHKQRRKYITRVYTMSVQLNNAPLMAWIQSRLDVVLNMVDANLQQPVDIYSLATHFAADNVSYMVYGRSFNLLLGENLEAGKAIRDAAIASAPFIRFSRLFSEILVVWPLTFLMPNFITRASLAQDTLMAINQKQIDHMNSLGRKPDPDKTAVGCLQAQAEFAKSLTEGHVKSECFDHVMAGADTTAASIIYMFYALAQPENYKYQERLRREVSSLPSPINFKDVCNLPYLNICVLEILRVYSPGPGSLQQRMTQADEVTILTIMGKTYTLPPATMVGIQAYALHRNESIYGEDVEKYKPERWETKDEARLQSMKDAWIPFGSGARPCLGMNLAIIELKVMVAAMLRGHTVELPPDAKPEDMVPLYGAVIRPKTERCELIFRSVV